MAYGDYQRLKSPTIERIRQSNACQWEKKTGAFSQIQCGTASLHCAVLGATGRNNQRVSRQIREEAKHLCEIGGIEPQKESFKNKLDLNCHIKPTKQAAEPKVYRVGSWIT